MGGEARGTRLRNWMTGKLSFTNNSHELPPMVFRDSGLVFKLNYAVATKVGQWSPCLCQKTCALLDPMDDEGTGGGDSGKEGCKGRLILLIMKYRKSSIKSPVWLIYLKHV